MKQQWRKEIVMVFQKRNPTCGLHQDADQSVKKTNSAPGREPWASLSRDFSPGSRHTFTLGTAAEGSTNAGLRLILTNSKKILSQCCFKSLHQRDKCSRTAETHTRALEITDTPSGESVYVATYRAQEESTTAASESEWERLLAFCVPQQSN